jgi:hypothetical protein
MTQMKRHAEALQEAFSRGVDPHTIELKDGVQGATPKIKGKNGQKLWFFFCYIPHKHHRVFWSHYHSC